MMLTRRVALVDVLSLALSSSFLSLRHTTLTKARNYASAWQLFHNQGSRTSCRNPSLIRVLTPNSKKQASSWRKTPKEDLSQADSHSRPLRSRKTGLTMRASTRRSSSSARCSGALIMEELSYWCIISRLSQCRMTKWQKRWWQC